MPRIVRLFALVLTVVGTARAVGAQVIETPVPFDSAGRVFELTPAIASRLGLAPPTFAVSGDFSRARLYASSSGGHVLVVERPSGVVERYQLPEQEVADLRSLVTRTVAGGPLPVETELPSQPAARQFTRNQLILGLLLYGPNLAALANDAKTGTVLYLLGAGGTYFGVAALTKNNTITRAQNRLATDGAIRGYLAANAALTAVAGDVPDGKTVAGVGLAGAIGGVLGGLAYGRGLTDSEAKAATTTSSFAALTAAGVLGTIGLRTENTERTVAATLVAAGAAGYVFGPRYPRSTSYRVTVGDINTLWVGATLGTAVALIPIVNAIDNNTISSEAGFAIGTAGMLGGAFLAERGWVRLFDHSGSDVTMMWLGTIAGGLVGAAGIVLFEPDAPAAALAMVTTGSILGAFTTHSMLGVQRAGTRSARFGGVEMDVDVSAAALAASGVRGTHPIVRLRF